MNSTLIISSPDAILHCDFELLLSDADLGPTIFTQWDDLKAEGYDTKTNFMYEKGLVKKPGEYSTAKFLDRKLFTEDRWQIERHKYEERCDSLEDHPERLERARHSWSRIRVSRLADDRIEVITREIPVFHNSQMQPGKFRDRTKAIIKYGQLFWRTAKKSNYIKKNLQPDKYDPKWFTKDFNKRSHDLEWFEFFSEGSLRDHINQRDIYGVKADPHKLQSWGGADIDLHIEKGGKPELFLKQVEAILTFLHGKGWIICSGTDVVNGIHVIKIYDHPKRLQTIQEELQDMLSQVSKLHPDLEQEAIEAGMTPICDAEIFPSATQGFRLPLGIGYTALLDRPLTLVKYHTYNGRPLYGADVVSFMNWDGTEMPLEAKLAYIGERVPRDLNDETAKAKKTTKKIQRHEREKDSSLKSDLTRKHLLGKMKRRYRKVLVDFFSGKMQIPKSLQTGILLGANALWAQDFPYEDRAEYLLERLQAIEVTNPEFSSRLNNQEWELILIDIQHIVDTSERIRQEPVADKHIEQSNDILRRWAKAMAEAGFEFGDPDSWRNCWQGMERKKLLFSPNDEDIEIIINHIAPVFGCDAETAIDAVLKMVLFATIKDAAGDGMGRDYRRALLIDCGIRCQENNKLARCWSIVEEAGFIYTKQQHCFDTDRPGEGRARGYAPGPRVREAVYHQRQKEGFPTDGWLADLAWDWMETGGETIDVVNDGPADPDWSDWTEVWLKLDNRRRNDLLSTSLL